MVGQNNGQGFHMATIPTFEETIANLPYDAMQRTVTHPSGKLCSERNDITVGLHTYKLHGFTVFTIIC